MPGSRLPARQHVRHWVVTQRDHEHDQSRDGDLGEHRQGGQAGRDRRESTRDPGGNERIQRAGDDRVCEEAPASTMVRKFRNEKLPVSISHPWKPTVPRPAAATRGGPK